ncbi:MAG: hypothetical protein AAGI66_04035 [Cyanobacteria bacterium P01_H01_bin.74]
MQSAIQKNAPLQKPLSAKEKHRQSQIIARLTYAGIILVFLSVCCFAVYSTMQMERQKTGFKAIHVKKPISFFDYTYVDTTVDTATESAISSSASSH